MAMASLLPSYTLVIAIWVPMYTPSLVSNHTCWLFCLQYGGVYADIDVWPIQPIDGWNREHAHDAALLLGIEYYYPDRSVGRTLPLQVTNWAMAAMPGHPLLGSMPATISKSIQSQFFEIASAADARKTYTDGILYR
jgi:hypothetical protein